jgi:hypothetical protein
MWVALRDPTERWRMLLALMLGVFLAGMVLSLVLAAHRMSTVVDADYYQNGLHYGRTASGAVNPGSEWRINAFLAGNDLRVVVLDQSGAPVRGGKLSLQPDSAAPASPPLQLAEIAPGAFSCPRPPSRQGELHGTLRFTCGEASATQKLVLFN